MKLLACFLLIVGVGAVGPVKAASLVDTVERVTPSVVAIGLFSPIDNPAPQIKGTGFVVGNGSQVITNYHVVNQALDPTIVQYYVVLSGKGQAVKQIKAEVAHIDPVHDIALLTFSEKLPALALAKDELLKPGSDIAFTGFPLGAVLGLYPATHKGIVAAVTPDAIPAFNSDQLTNTMLKRLASSSLIYQLDATAYPGNSGSAVYNPLTGEVVGIINKVIVRDTKESAFASPTGISYAVPVNYIRALLEKT